MGKVTHIKSFQAKYPLHLQKIACSYTVVFLVSVRGEQNGCLHF